MTIGWIDEQNLAAFRPLLLPEAAAALSRGAPVTALGLTQADVACGAAAAWVEDDGTLSIRSLYVSPSHRRMGGGRLLVDALCRAAEGLCTQAECAYNQTEPEHQTLEAFLTALGFQREREEGGIYLVKVGDLDRSPFLGKVHGAPKGPVPFSQISLQLLKEAYKRALAAGENYLEVPLTHPSVHPEASVAMLYGGAVRSFVVLTRGTPGQVTLAWAKSAVPQDLPLLLCSAFARLRAACPPDTALVIRAIHQASAQLAAAILPDAQPVSRLFTRSLVEG